MSRKSKSNKNPNNPNLYVTTGECKAMMEPLCANIHKMQTALVGDDFQGGLAKTVSNMSTKFEAVLKYFENERAERKEKEESLRKWRLALFAASTGLIGVIIGQLLSSL